MWNKSKMDLQFFLKCLAFLSCVHMCLYSPSYAFHNRFCCSLLLFSIELLLQVFLPLSSQSYEISEGILSLCSVCFLVYLGQFANKCRFYNDIVSYFLLTMLLMMKTPDCFAVLCKDVKPLLFNLINTVSWWFQFFIHALLASDTIFLLKKNDWIA